MAQYRPWARQEETVFVAGSFDTAADGTVAATTTRRGKGWTVAKTGTGIYEVTITSDGTRKYPSILSAVANAVKTGDHQAHVSIVNATTGVITIEVDTAGTAANLATGEIHFVIVAKNTGLA
jgi:hypothetical protein